MVLTMRQALAQSGLAPLDAQVLLAHVTGRDRAWLGAHANEPLPAAQVERFFSLARRRRDGEPIAYLTGEREFWSLSLRVTRDVLIPRPETETLIELLLARMPVDQPLNVLDLGTGSGAIALALAYERPRARVVATDASAAALAVARDNAQRLRIANVEFVQSDWYANVPSTSFDVIAANPPYVDADDAHLREGDLRFEPASALTPGSEGLAALRHIVSQAPAHLAPGGTLAVEHGYDQGDAVRALFESAGFNAITSMRDLAGITRVMTGTR